MPATPPIRCASSPARSRSWASPASTSPSVTCWTGSSRPSIDEVLAPTASARRRGLAPPGPRRRHRTARRRARLARRAVGGPHRHQPGAPHRDAERVAGQRRARKAAVRHTLPRVRGSSSAVSTSSLSVPLSDIWITIRFTLPAGHGRRRHAGRHHRGRLGRHAAVLAIAAGCRRRRCASRREPTTAPPSRSSWDPEEVADHTGVTATFGAPLAPGLTLVPDALVGRCWPAVFAVIGSAVTDVGLPGRRGPAQPGAPRPRRAPARADAQVQGRIDRHRNGFRGRRHRGRPRRSRVGDASATPRAPSWRRSQERFAIRGRTGAVELTDPPRAGGAITDNATDTPRRRRRDVTVTAPTDMSAFAVVSGDHNPIHTDRAAALLAGLKSPIVHGMWLSAAAQHVVTATDGTGHPARTSGRLDVALPRHGHARRRDRLPRRPRRHRPRCRDHRGHREGRQRAGDVGDRAVRRAEDGVRVPRPGHPAQGHGHGGPGAVQGRPQGVGHRRQVHPRHAGLLGAARGARQPDQPDRQRRALPAPRGRALPDAVHPGRDGHGGGRPGGRDARAGRVRRGRASPAATPSASTPRWPACPACTRWRRCWRWCSTAAARCTTSCRATSTGRSNYRLAAIRPSQIDLDDDDVTDWVAEIAERTGEFLQIVNFNLRGSQYAIAGTVRGLEVLEEEVEKRREISGGKRSFILVPGIDVPFHSSVLRVGVADFRRSLERVMPRDADPALLIGRYIPNLVPRPFTLDRDFIQEIRDLVPAEPLDEILADYDTWRNEKPHELCRKVVIELLAWQFASPVRWIETQDLLFIEEAAGGLGIERFVEIGVKSAPTVAGLATNTLKLPEYSHNTTEVLNSERDAAVLFATDTDPEPDVEEDVGTGAAPPRPRPAAAVGPRSGRGTRPAPSRRSRAQTTSDLRRRRRHAGAHRAVGEDAHRPDRAAGLHRVDHRRGVLATQPAAGRPRLRAQPRRDRRRGRGRPGRAQGAGHQAGPDLQALRPSALRCGQRSAAHGPRPVGQASRRHRRTGQEDLGARRRLGQARHDRARARHPRGHQRARWRTRPPARRRTAGRGDRRQGRRRGRRRRRGAARASPVSLPSAAGGGGRRRGLRRAR